MDLRPILYVIGILLMILSISMIAPIIADLYFKSPDWKVFALSAVFTSFFGGALVLSNKSKSYSITVRQAFLLTVISWVSIALFGTLPFMFSELEMSFTDAFFESISGITATGATIMTSIETAPPGILLWRAMLQWLGGLGFIVMAMSILPLLKVGGMPLFRTESSESEKALPRAAQLAKSIGGIYIVLTFSCMIGYVSVGMTGFQALAHSLTTLSTGGFSTFDTSFRAFETAGPEIVGIIFMILGGLPFILYIKMINGKSNSILKDSQVRFFLSIIAISTLCLVAYLTTYTDMQPAEALRKSLFNVISVMTGTGYASADYYSWGGFPISFFFFLTFVGGCAGSTTGGMKVFRFQVLFSVFRVQLKKLLHPHGVFIPYYNGKPIPKDIPLTVMGFFFAYIITFAFGVMALSFIGLDFMTAISGSATAISNVGPGLGEIIGPAGTFSPLPESAKWIMGFLMLLGRLELFTVFVIFSAHFWKS